MFCFGNKEKILHSQRNRSNFFVSFFLLSPSIKKSRHARHKLKIHVKEFFLEGVKEWMTIYKNSLIAGFTSLSIRAIRKRQRPFNVEFFVSSLFHFIFSTVSFFQLTFNVQLCFNCCGRNSWNILNVFRVCVKFLSLPGFFVHPLTDLSGWPIYGNFILSYFSKCLANCGKILT